MSISTSMKSYDYYLYGDRNTYGQPVLSEQPVGKISACITVASQTIQDSIAYSNCSYVGLTLDSNVSDRYVIAYGDEMLKVQYVTRGSRYTQLYLGRMQP